MALRRGATARVIQGQQFEILIQASEGCLNFMTKNTLGCWVDRLIDQASDGPSIILTGLDLGYSKLFFARNYEKK